MADRNWQRILIGLKVIYKTGATQAAADVRTVHRGVTRITTYLVPTYSNIALSSF